MDITTKITPKLSEKTNKVAEATNSTKSKPERHSGASEIANTRTVGTIQSTVLEPEIITETSKPCTLVKPSKTNLKFKDYGSN